MHVVLDSLDLAEAERKLCAHALSQAGTIIEAASLLGITRHALKRRITKHGIAWPPAELSPNMLNSPVNLANREYTAQHPANPRFGQAQDLSLGRGGMRGTPAGINPQMHAPKSAPMPQHPAYERHNNLDNGRARPTPPQHGMPGMMTRPDIHEFDR